MDLESFKPDCTINYHTGSSSGRSVATDSMQKVTADDGEIMSIKNKKVTRCDATAWWVVIYNLLYLMFVLSSLY